MSRSSDTHTHLELAGQLLIVHACWEEVCWEGPASPLRCLGGRDQQACLWPVAQRWGVDNRAHTTVLKHACQVLMSDASGALLPADAYSAQTKPNVMSCHLGALSSNHAAPASVAGSEVCVISVCHAVTPALGTLQRRTGSRDVEIGSCCVFCGLCIVRPDLGNTRRLAHTATSLFAPDMLPRQPTRIEIKPEDKEEVQNSVQQQQQLHLQASAC
jgi:hypothetical protein